MIGKSIRILLICALAFFACAPLIVGLYDAANERSREAGSTGIIRFSGGVLSGGAATGYPILDIEASVQESVAENTLSLIDWYSGDPALSNLLGSGDAALTYEFADGTTVDFGNPYILDWSDVPQPDDYDEAVHDDGESSIFAPEKAYAGPISWLTGKLKYLAVKSGYWKSFNSMVYSMAITICMSTGMNYTAATQCVNKVVAELPAITRVITSETAVFTTEDTAMLVANSISRVAARKVAVSEFPAALNAEIAANVTAVETTGMLAGGATGNFINALYQLAATGGVPASILYSDIGLYIGSWLGGNFDDYFQDVPGADLDTQGTINWNGYPFSVSFASLGTSAYSPRKDVDFPPAFLKDDVLFGDYNNGQNGYAIYIKDGYAKITHQNPDGTCGYDRNFMTYTSSPTVGDTSVLLATTSGKYDYTSNYVLNSDVKWSLFNDVSGEPIAVYEPGLGWVGQVDTSGDLFGETVSNGFAGQIVGQDAQYDDAGNITDYGNVSVSDVTAGDYQAPTTWQGALSQMDAAAIEQGSTITDPVIGNQGTTVGDWIGQNQTPAPTPSTDAGQDDFEISDLETVFPYCIPWDLYYLLAAFAADPVAPNFTWVFDLGYVGYYEYRVDLSQFDFVAGVFRTCETLAFCVGLVLVTRNLIRG